MGLHPELTVDQARLDALGDLALANVAVTRAKQRVAKDALSPNPGREYRGEDHTSSA